ncbi:MAG: proline--tRNA ligase [Rickettsiales bacterium]|jgi:prolyl-tRNA synthetase|nr:proline--tRNA ligase [Rickettsiales bacterium]
MLLSQSFLPTLKEDPREAEIISHKLMLRSGMISKTASGIYSFLPLGIRVLRKIENIIRAEHKNAGIEEVLMPIIQPASLWRESGRYDDYGAEMMRVKDRHDKDFLFGPTNEEIITDIFRKFISSYKDLPSNLFQIQWKFRDEIRPRFGVMRSREFFMKDAYSFDINHEAAAQTYQKYFKLYLKIFRQIGVTAIPVRAETGAIGGDLSHEFQILADTGESEVFCDKKLIEDIENGNDDFKTLTNYYQAADDMHDKNKNYDFELVAKRGIEVGQIFNFGEKYSKAMNCTVNDANGNKIHPNMGSYGIGVSRLVAAIIESSHDDKGIIWPKEIAPFDVVIINLASKNQECIDKANQLYQRLKTRGLDILLDDKDDQAGTKFARNDLIGIPTQLIIGPRAIKNGMIEVKDRKTGANKEVAFDSY